jgi:hypothetical protein
LPHPLDPALPPSPDLRGDQVEHDLHDQLLLSRLELLKRGFCLSLGIRNLGLPPLQLGNVRVDPHMRAVFHVVVADL